MKNFNWNKHKTDKLDHGYDVVYDKFLSTIRNDVKSVIEIGSRVGSAKLWLDYFPNAHVYSVDLKTFNINDPRFTMLKINQGDTSALNKAFNDPNGYDVIIDDGPHSSPEQLISFDFFKDKFNKLYIVEDLHCTNINEGEPLINGVAPLQKDSEITFQDLFIDIENKKIKDYKYFNGSQYVSDNLKVNKERGTKKRWSHMTNPSEIFFIEKQ